MQELRPGLFRRTTPHPEYLPVELVLVSYGEPVLADGRTAMKRALAQPHSSSATAA